MNLQEHITQAQTMIRALPLIDEAAREQMANALVSPTLSRQEMTDIRLQLRNQALLSPEGAKDKTAVDKVLLGLMTRLPISDSQKPDKMDMDASPTIGAQTDKPQKIRKSPVKASENEPDIFHLLISIACKDKEAKKLSLAFWEKLAVEIEKMIDATL